MPTRLADGLEAKNLLLCIRYAPVLLKQNLGSPVCLHGGDDLGNLFNVILANDNAETQGLFSRVELYFPRRSDRMDQPGMREIVVLS